MDNWYFIWSNFWNLIYFENFDEIVKMSKSASNHFTYITETGEIYKKFGIGFDHTWALCRVLKYFNLSNFAVTFELAQNRYFNEKVVRVFL